MGHDTFRHRLAMAISADARSQRELADLLGVTSSQISGWKRGVAPKPELIGSVIDLLQIDGHWLMTGEGRLSRDEERETLDLRLDVIGKVADGRIEDETLQQVRLKARGSQRVTELSDIEKRISEIEEFEFTPIAEATPEEREQISRLFEKAKEAVFGSYAVSVPEGTNGA
ncbi:MAG: helix-turn-helix transcriptional regulator [Gemmatimonadota bacterium]|nr:helix-turn-helix transcriptional regulator [Gemmatimonadota bacterium]